MHKNQEKNNYDAVIVGSGAGGGTIAYELAKKRKKVLIIEAGPIINPSHLGNFWQVAVFRGYYYRMAVSSVLKGSTIIYRTSNVGGTTVFSCGNMARCLEKEFLSLGVNLNEEFVEAEQELCVEPLPKEKIIFGTKAITEAAKKLGYNMNPMPKGCNVKTVCNLCGSCVAGCHQEAKWDARFYINQALANNAILAHSTKVKKVLFSNNGEVRGVEIVNSGGKKEIECGLVILSSGALSTPVILQNSGISAGKGLFVDLFNVTYGITKSLSQLKGPTMGTVAEFKDKGFILSPFIDHWSQQFIFCPFWWNVIYGFKRSRIVGIMTKIADERAGQVKHNGLVKKILTKQDKFRLNLGSDIAKKILSEAGASNVITTKHPRGAHPGGTAAVGEVVDENLKVYGREGLYVCDASVFPVAPGLPPILTIVALAKKLAKSILKTVLI